MKRFIAALSGTVTVHEKALTYTHFASLRVESALKQKSYCRLFRLPSGRDVFEGEGGEEVGARCGGVGGAVFTCSKLLGMACGNEKRHRLCKNASQDGDTLVRILFKKIWLELKWVDVQVLQVAVGVCVCVCVLTCLWHDWNSNGVMAIDMQATAV